MEKEMCAACWGAISVWEYNGWICKSCTPEMQPCKNQGCTYTDIDNKCEKHERFFCQQETKCEICEADVSRGTLSAHYDSVHQDITSRAGSTWRATQGWQYRLVSSVAGTAVCAYDLVDTEFYIYVNIPMSTERLKEFDCEVQVTHPTTGHTQTYTPDVDYNDWYDWHILVKKEELPCWSEEFDVIVNINKIQ